LLYAHRSNGFDISEWMWQIVDVDLLKTHLTQSIFYLHSEPPLLNLSLGVVLKVTADQIHAKQLLLDCFRLMGLFLVLITFQLMLDLGVPIAIALVLTLLFEFNPGTLMLENWFYTTYPTEVFLCAAAFFLNRFLSQGKSFYGVSFLVCTALPIFINSSFQPLWFIGVVAFSYYFVRERMRKILPATLVVLGLIAGLLIKNAMIFGVATTSSWLGMNLTRMTTSQIPEHERQQEIHAGELSEFAAIPEFSDLEAYPMVMSKPTGIPVLDERLKANGDINFNNISYVEISRRYLRDALRSLIHHPGLYFRSMLRGSGCYLGALKDQDLFLRNTVRLGAWNYAYDLILQPRKFSWWPRHQDCTTMSLTLLDRTPSDFGVKLDSPCWGNRMESLRHHDSVHPDDNGIHDRHRSYVRNW